VSTPLGATGALPAGKEGMEHVRAFSVKTVDSTGAGDAFIGSFATFLGEGLAERDAVQKANLYAGLSTTGVGTQKSFYDRSRFENEWASITRS
jgi:ribokinase